ncbi:MAG: response regulator [Clostridiales bacterium]|nr:response regulator [Clostridiales bacterium]
MRKIMIIDDEMLVRVGLKSCVEWEKHGYTIAAMAENALEGLAMMESVKPDIVITDIRMPEMDGLTFIEKAKARYPQTKIIVLSCYNELDYVKRAMKSGAEDYILKLSIEPEKLLEFIRRLDDDQSQTTEAPPRRQERINNGGENLLVLRESLLQRFLAGGMPEDDFVREMRGLDARWPGESPVLIYGGILQYWSALDRSEINVKPLFKYSCINILEELMQELGGGVAFEWQDRYYLLALKTDDIQKAIDFCHNANRTFTQYLNLSFSWGISSVGASKSIRSLFRECVNAYAWCFYYQNETVVTSDIAGAQEFLATDADSYDNLPEMIGTDTRDYARKIQEMLTLFVKTHVHPGSVKRTMLRVAYELASAGRRIAAGAGLEWQPKEDPLDALPNTDTIWQIGDYFKRTLSDLDAAFSAAGIGERPEIFRVKTYVDQHIREDISLDQAAKVCGMSRSYFSSLFKKETGEGLNDFINRRKMERAKELMLLHRMKAYEAAYAVGISDESYFSKLFKKYIGVSPKRLKTNEITEK